MQSRYYDPEIGRFINADSFASTGQGILGNNMYAYCLNNPVNYMDPTGETSIMGALGGAVLRKIAVAIAGFIGALIVGDTIAKNPPDFPSISLPKAQATSKAEIKSEAKAIAPALPKKRSKDPTHHVVAKADARAAESRQILRDVGIEPLSDPRNLIVLPQNYHASLHTTAYHNYVTERLRPVAGDKAAIEDTLASLKAEILLRSSLGIRWD